MKTKLKSILAAALCAVGFAAQAVDPVTYLDWDEVNHKLTNATCTAYETVTASSPTSFAAGKTYVVKGAVTRSGAITVKGVEPSPTRFILCDGAKLTASKGLTVSKGYVLVICAQEGGTGALEAKGASNGAGIGGGSATKVAGGTITINGGVVTATGGSGGAGIGGSSGKAGGKVTINGGTVTATGGNGGAGIGGGSGQSGTGGTVTINGGVVMATGGNGGAGIGGGIGAAGGTVAINGGSVTATGTGGAAVAGIGRGANSAPGTVTFGTSFAGGVLAGTNAASAVYMTTEAYAADHNASYVTMPQFALKIPAPSGYSYVVSNETAQLTGVLADGTNTYGVVTGATVKVYFTLDEGYIWKVSPKENPMVVEKITGDTVVDAKDLPTAERALTVTNVKTATHWPWNGKIDITCDLTGEGMVQLAVALTTNGVKVCDATAANITGTTEVDLDAVGGVTNGVTFVWDAKADVNDAAFLSDQAKITVTATKASPSASAESAAFAIDVREEIALAKGAVTVAGVRYSDTAWGAADAADVTLGWTNETTSATGVLKTGLTGSGVKDVALPKKNGAYKLTHSTGGLTSFVSFTVTGQPVSVTLPTTTGYGFAVSNLTGTAEEILPTEVGGTTYLLPIGAKVGIYAVAEEGYVVTGKPYIIEEVASDTTIDTSKLPTAEKGKPEISAVSAAAELDLTPGDRVARDEETLVVNPAWGGVKTATVQIDGEPKKRTYDCASNDLWTASALEPGRYGMELEAGTHPGAAGFWKVGADWIVLEGSNFAADVTLEGGRTYLVFGTNTIGGTLTAAADSLFLYDEGAPAGFKGEIAELPKMYRLDEVDGLKRIIAKAPGCEDNPWKVGKDGTDCPRVDERLGAGRQRQGNRGRACVDQGLGRHRVRHRGGQGHRRERDERRGGGVHGDRRGEADAAGRLARRVPGGGRLVRGDGRRDGVVAAHGAGREVPAALSVERQG